MSAPSHDQRAAIRSLTEIVADRQNTNANRAAECLRVLDELPADDLARPDFQAAAQTFAQLAIADVLKSLDSRLEAKWRRY